MIDLRCCDCLDGMAQMQEQSVDIVVTSPPYNLGIKYAKYADDVSRDAYLEWCDQWLALVKRVLKPAGSFFLNVGASPSNPWLPHELALRVRPLLTLQNTLHWAKSMTVTPKNAEPVSVGHFKPINSKRYVNDCHEYVFHFTHDGNVPIDRLAVGVQYADKSNVTRWKSGRDLRCRGNVWHVPYSTISDRQADRPHPATYPPQLAEWCIRLHGVRVDTVVLDPFVGIGSTAIGAVRAGVSNVIGFDLDQGYIDEAVARVVTACAQNG